MVAIYLGRHLGGHKHVRGDRQNGGTRENVIGEICLCTDEEASGQREAACAAGSQGSRSFSKKQTADLTIPLEIASGDAVLYALCL